MNRQLGSCEKLAYYLEYHYPGNFTIVANLTRVHRKQFDQAVQYAFLQHPLLSANIASNNGDLEFQLSNLPLEVNVQHYDQKLNLKNVIEKSLIERFDPLILLL